MRLTAPSYYPRFACIAGNCQHSCCIGWEIDIDEDTHALYQSMEGALGQRIRDSITENDGVPCFRLGEGERCPHLNQDGLCEIILGAGTEYLAQICDDHPRYRNYFSDRVEIGLGLACEAAARLVLGETGGVTDIILEDDDEEEELTPWEFHVLTTRLRLVATVQDRTRPLTERISEMLSIAEVACDLSLRHWQARLRGLERLDTAWDRCLDKLSEVQKNSGTTWDIPLEQFTVYLLHRHLADAVDESDLIARVAFAALGYTVLHALAEHDCAQGEIVTIDTLAEYARLWSSEIEYSEENTAACLAYFKEND